MKLFQAKRLAGRVLVVPLLALAAAMLPSVSSAQGTTPSRYRSMNYLATVPLPPPPSDGPTELSPLQEIVLSHNQEINKNPATGNRDRVVYIDGPKKHHPVYFSVNRGAPVVAGNGRVLGHLASNVYDVIFNFGQSRLIGGSLRLLAFATKTAEVGGVTGWVKYSDLRPSTNLSDYAWVLGIDAQNTPDHGDAPGTYQVACANPDDWGNGLLKIDPNVNENIEKHDAAADYVQVPSDKACYLLLSLPRYGGLATDVLSDGDVFVRSAGVPQVEVPLYLPKHPTAEEQLKWDSGIWPHQMAFVYGRVGFRYGWIPNADLGPASLVMPTRGR